MDEAGVRVEAVHGVLRVDGQGRLEDLPEQLGAGILGADLAQVGPELDADAVEAVAALAVDDRLGGEDRPAAPGVALEVEDLAWGRSTSPSRADPLGLGHEPLEEVAHLGGGMVLGRREDLARGPAGGNAPWPSARASAMARLVVAVRRRIASARDSPVRTSVAVPERP